MRRTDETGGELFSYFDLEQRIQSRHPLRRIWQMVNVELASLGTDFEAPDTDAFEERAAIAQNYGTPRREATKDLTARAQRFRDRGHSWKVLANYLIKNQLS